MRVIFLDFDGVLNHPGIYAEVERKYGLGPDKLERWSQFSEAEWLDPALVARVGTLALECDAVIAVVSSWRQRHNRAALYGLLKQRGLPDGVLVARCEPSCSKGDAVRGFLRHWAMRGGVSSYVVIDDGPGELPDPGRLVKTSGAVGITPQDIERARRILLEDP